MSSEFPISNIYSYVKIIDGMNVVAPQVFFSGTITSNTIITNNIETDGQVCSNSIIIKDVSSGLSDNRITITAPVLTGSGYSLTLPVDDGGVGEFLQTDGDGVLSWVTAGGTLALPSANVFIGDISNSATATTLSKGASIDNTGSLSLNTIVTVAAGSYTDTDITVDSKGRITNISSGSIGGIDTGIQYNNGGAFGGSPTLSFDGSNLLTFGTAGSVSTLTTPTSGTLSGSLSIPTTIIGTDGSSGNINLTSGNGGSLNGSSGNINLTSGNGGSASGSAGYINIAAGNSNPPLSSVSGGSVTIRSGDGYAAGDINIKSGENIVNDNITYTTVFTSTTGGPTSTVTNSYTTTATIAAGNISIRSTNTLGASSRSGSIFLSTGNVNGATAVSGDINISTGTGSLGATRGEIRFTAGTGNMDIITSGNITNVSGTELLLRADEFTGTVNVTGNKVNIGNAGKTLAFFDQAGTTRVSAASITTLALLKTYLTNLGILVNA